MMTQPFMRLWDALTVPPPAVHAPELRRRVRALIVMLLVMIVVVSLTPLLVRDLPPALVVPSLLAGVLATGVYALLRTRWYRWGLRAYIALALVYHVPLLAISSLGNLLFAVTSYLMVCLFLTLRQAALYGAAAFALIVLAYIALPGQPVYQNVRASLLLTYIGVTLVAVLLTVFVRQGDAQQIVAESQRARDASRRLRALLDAAPDNIYFKDCEGRFVLVNRATWVNDGFPSAEAMLGQTDHTLYGVTEDDTNVQAERRLLATGEPIINQEFRVPGRDLADPRAWVLVSKVPLYDDDGRILGLIGINRDITDRKREEAELLAAKNAAEAANRARAAFLAEISHELRTPLNVILGMSQWLLHDTDLPPELAESVQAIHRSGEHLLRLINTLLAHTRAISDPPAAPAATADTHNALSEPLMDTQPATPTRPLPPATAGTSLSGPINLSEYVAGDRASPAQILIVDDQPENLLMLTNILRSQGYTVYGAQDGQAALRAVQLTPPDLILLDVRMPGLNGYQVCERLKADPRFRYIPVIFLSVADETLDKVRAFELGAVDYITKPFEVAELRMRIATHLAVHRLATAEERQRLARDLHDAVSQSLFSASMIAESLPILLDRGDIESLRASLGELARLTKGTLAEMRALLMELRPDALAQTDLPTLLSYLVNSARARTTAHISVTCASLTEAYELFLPTDVKINLYRIAQEALSNSVKHAQASRVDVALHKTPAGVILRIQDNGCGFDSARLSPPHMGLRIMRERAASVGVWLTVTSAIQQGTTIEAVWRSTGD